MQLYIDDRKVSEVFHYTQSVKGNQDVKVEEGEYDLVRLKNHQHLKILESIDKIRDQIAELLYQAMLKFNQQTRR